MIINVKIIICCRQRFPFAKGAKNFSRKDLSSCDFNLSGEFTSALKFAFYEITLSSQNPIFAFNNRFLFLTSDFSCAISFSRRWLNVPVCLIQARSEDDGGISQAKKRFLSLWILKWQEKFRCKKRKIRKEEKLQGYWLK
jgi:hypothetical protein